MSTFLSLLPMIAGLLLAPLMVGIVNRTKAWFGGRKGPPLTQRYRDVWKMLHKGAVYSLTATWVFRTGPVVGLATVILAMTMVPLGPIAAPFRFSGDLIVVLGLLALGRFATMLAALDTGSSFEGMGASREAQFSALAEPVAFFALAALVRESGAFSLSEIYAALSAGSAWLPSPIVVLAAVALLAVYLVENSRIPVDDPTTHLELTMIHEVMVLDHGGPDLAFIEYAATLKLWLLGSLVAGLLFPPWIANPWLAAAVMIVGMALLAVLLGIIESTMARLRLHRVPELIVGGGASAGVAFLLTLMELR